MFVTYREQCLLVGAAFGFSEEIGKFVVASQFEMLPLMDRNCLTTHKIQWLS
jgi:hypothetical protein